MDQAKIGAFLKALRKEHQLTQEQLAERLGVSNRTISRWEHGSNMPDFDLLITMAKYYQVGIEEILNGERTAEQMDQKTEATLHKVAEYTNEERAHFNKRLHWMFLLGVAGFLLFALCDILGLEDQPPYEGLASFGLGLAFGMLIVGVIFTSRYAARIHSAKARLLHRKE